MYLHEEQFPFQSLNREVLTDCFYHPFFSSQTNCSCSHDICIENPFRLSNSPRTFHSCRRQLISPSESFFRNHPLLEFPYYKYFKRNSNSKTSCEELFISDVDQKNKTKSISIEEDKNWQIEIQLPKVGPEDVKVEVKEGDILVEAQKKKGNKLVLFKHKQSLPQEIHPGVLCVSLNPEGRLLVKLKKEEHLQKEEQKNLKQEGDTLSEQGLLQIEKFEKHNGAKMENNIKIVGSKSFAAEPINDLVKDIPGVSEQRFTVTKYKIVAPEIPAIPELKPFVSEEIPAVSKRILTVTEGKQAVETKLPSAKNIQSKFPSCQSQTNKPVTKIIPIHIDNTIPITMMPDNV